MPTQRAYSRTELAREFRQSEILTGVYQYFYNPIEERVDRIIKDYCVILSQDCDLLQDFDRRADGKPGGLNGILLFEARTIAAWRASGMSRGEFEKISTNNVDRYHFMQAVAADEDGSEAGMPELIIDFKKYFTVSAVDLHWQVGLDGGPKRRCRLLSPYMEHLQSRAANYMARIALPIPHEVGARSFQEALPAPTNAGKK